MTHAERIERLRDFARAMGLHVAVLWGVVEEPASEVERELMVTYGQTLELADGAAGVGDVIKRAAGWRMDGPSLTERSRKLIALVETAFQEGADAASGAAGSGVAFVDSQAKRTLDALLAERL